VVAETAEVVVVADAAEAVAQATAETTAEDTAEALAEALAELSATLPGVEPTARRPRFAPRHGIVPWLRARPRFVAGASAIAVVLVAVGMLVLGPARPVSADGTTSGTVAGVALATPTPEPTQGPTSTASPTLEPTPTPYDLMTPRTIIPPNQLTGYVWPLANARVTLPFGPTPWGQVVIDGQLFHDGLDITTGCGDKVFAAHDGVVLAAGRHYDDFVGWNGSLQPYYNWLTTHRYWNSLPIVIVIDDGNGYRSIYAHEAEVTVRVGQIVKAGDVIGYEGATGYATGCHVHLSLFNTLETRTFSLDPGVAKRNRLPASELARVDPLLVLPLRCDVIEQVRLRPAEAASCPPPTRRPYTPTKKPTPTSSPTEVPTVAPTVGTTLAPTADTSAAPAA
jgi:murein DD-endopeptidase MepM/ murein hydrolase activator NlpD